MPSPGDALAAKLAELVGSYPLTGPDDWRHGRVDPEWLVAHLLAWVAEQRAAGATIPATRGNNPADARTGAAPTPEPSEASGVGKSSQGAPDLREPWHECVGTGGERPWRMGSAGACSICAPAPDAALRAALQTAADALDGAACRLGEWGEAARAASRKAREAITAPVALPPDTGRD